MIEKKTKAETKTKTKTRGAKRDPAVIEKELEDRLAKLREKKRLASTPGLKDLREARDLIEKAWTVRNGDLATTSLLSAINALVEDMERA